jgi:hypothetical protein
MCAAMLPADSHMDNFLSPVIRDKNEGPMPSLILRELLGKNEDIRSGSSEWKKQIAFRLDTGCYCQRGNASGETAAS